MALAAETANQVYASAGYEQSAENMSRTSLESDNVFSDGYNLQIPTFTGTTGTGFSLEFSCAT